ASSAVHPKVLVPRLIGKMDSSVPGIATCVIVLLLSVEVDGLGPYRATIRDNAASGAIIPSPWSGHLSGADTRARRSRNRERPLVASPSLRSDFGHLVGDHGGEESIPYPLRQELRHPRERADVGGHGDLEPRSVHSGDDGASDIRGLQQRARTRAGARGQGGVDDGRHDGG